MSTYAPNYFPSSKRSFTAGAAVTGGQLLYISAANTVSPTSAATPSWIGVAENDAASGGVVTVYCEGEHLLTASGSISAGDPVIPAAAGAVATISTDTTYTHVVGVALTAATNGNTVTVRLRA